MVSSSPCIADALSKSEVARNVLDYYIDRKRDLQRCLDNYSGAAGAGFVCWRFVMMDASRARCLSHSGDGDVRDGPGRGRLAGLHGAGLDILTFV